MQVVCERTAGAQAAGQHDMERAHVAVSVAASVEQVYKAIKVISHYVFFSLAVFSLCIVLPLPGDIERLTT